VEAYVEKTPHERFGAPPAGVAADANAAGPDDCPVIPPAPDID
jgi:hypothetical protein